MNIHAIEKDILGEAFISTEPLQNLHQLCSLGSRFAGTPSETQAIEFLVRKLEEYDLDHCHTEAVEYLGWWRGVTQFKVTEPTLTQLDGIGLPWTPSTPSTGVEAELIDLGHGTHMDYSLHKDEIPDKIVMTSAYARARGVYPSLDAWTTSLRKVKSCRKLWSSRFYLCEK